MLKIIDEEKSCNKYIVYKPKDLTSDKFYYKTLEWCYKALSVQFRSPKYLIKKTYAWMEYIEQTDVECEVNLKKFYYKFGIVLAVSYLLLAKDLHAHNVIASSDGPLIIDLECILTPCIKGISTNSNFLILNTMLLPQKKFIADGFSGFEIGALSQIQGEYHIGSEYFMENDGTDEMFISKRKKTIPKAKNIPILKHEQIDCLKYRIEIEKGFIDGYKLIEKNKSWLINATSSPLKLAKSLPIRLVLRSTWEYMEYIHTSFSASLMKDPIKWKKHFLSLRNTNNKIKDNKLLEHEQKMLQLNIIPTFWGYSDESFVKTGYGTLITIELSVCSFHRLLRHIESFTQADLVRQLNVFKQSLFCYKQNQKRKCRKIKPNNADSILNLEKLKVSSLASLWKLAFKESDYLYWTKISRTKRGVFFIEKIDLIITNGILSILLVLAFYSRGFALKEMLSSLNEVCSLITGGSEKD